MKKKETEKESMKEKERERIGQQDRGGERVKIKYHMSEAGEQENVYVCICL